MLKKTLFLVLIFLLISQTFGQAKLRLIYINNVDGYLRACHCPGNLFGGLLYAVDVVDKLRAENPNTIFVDSGDLFPAKNWEPKARFAIEFYNRMGLDALNIGEQEFWFGVNYLRKMANKSRFNILSANLYWHGKPLFKPYIIKELDGIKVAVIGLLNPELIKRLDNQKIKGIEVKSYEDTLNKVLADIKTQNVDLIILLSHAGDAFDRQVASKFPQINFIVSGHSEKLFEQPVVVGKTALLQAEHYAHYIGVLDINYLGAGKFSYKNKMIKLENVAVIEDAAKIYQKYLDATDALVDSLSKTVSLQQKNYQAVPKSSDCGSCHFDEYNHWSRTPHAFAWSVIQEDGRTSDVSCISCHTTWFGKKGGFLNTTSTPQLVNVGCVSCHVDFKGHPQQKKTMEPVKESTCIECHDRPNSPDFNFETYRQAVLHELDYFTIKKGDWLSKIAERKYGNPFRWPIIYRANRPEINNPNLIFPGQKIILPRIPENKIKK